MGDSQGLLRPHSKPGGMGRGVGVRTAVFYCQQAGQVYRAAGQLVSRIKSLGNLNLFS